MGRKTEAKFAEVDLLLFCVFMRNKIINNELI